jgi:hypothetical protein
LLLVKGIVVDIKLVIEHDNLPLYLYEDHKLIRHTPTFVCFALPSVVVDVAAALLLLDCVAAVPWHPTTYIQG